MRNFYKLTDKYFWKNKFVFWTVLAANLLSVFYGLFYFYKDQLLSSPIWQWIVIPDSPTYVLLFAISALGIAYNKLNNNLLNVVAFIGLVKIGLWTVFVIPLYGNYFLFPANANWFIFLGILHIGMILEAIVLLPRIKLNHIHLLIAFAWFIVGDLSDYVLFNTLPRPDILLQNPEKLALLAKESFGSTILITAVLIFMLKTVFYSSASKTGTS